MTVATSAMNTGAAAKRRLCDISYFCCLVLDQVELLLIMHANGILLSRRISKAGTFEGTVLLRTVADCHSLRTKKAVQLSDVLCHVRL